MLNKNELVDIAVIIPISPNETHWENLFIQLKEIENGFRVYMVMNSSEQANSIRSKIRQYITNTLVLVTKGGRAELMNFAAELTEAKYLWFLHADSKLPDDYLLKIRNAIMKNEDAIYYFDLSFETKKLSLMKLNAIGTYFRSHILKLPFGDQGFFMSRSIFQKLGKYKEKLQYGEDHLLIWQAHQNHVPVRCIGTTIATSPRKYMDQGWVQTTLMHLRLTMLQAGPEFLKLWKSKIL